MPSTAAAGAEALRVELAHCHSKARYSEQSVRHAARWWRRHGTNVVAYRCSFCGSWHVGHSPTKDTLERIALAIRYRRGELGERA